MTRVLSALPLKAVPHFVASVSSQPRPHGERHSTPSGCPQNSGTATADGPGARPNDEDPAPATHGTVTDAETAGPAPVGSTAAMVNL